MVLQPDVPDYGECAVCGVQFDERAWLNRHDIAPRDGLSDEANSVRSELQGSYCEMHCVLCELGECVS